MAGLVLDGKALAKQIEGDLTARVENLKATSGKVPILATILVGENPASVTYVKMKGNACRRVGMESLRIALPEESTTERVLAEIDKLNADPDVHGILLQHPVPDRIDERRCFDRIDPAKDVDGVTCLGFGRMAMGEPAYGSATPAGVIRLLAHYQIPLAGKHAVVVGRSPILGKPLAMMLLNGNATVTVCHSRTQGLPEIVRQAEIVVGAVGKPEFIKGDWIKAGAVVVDAGYNEGNVGDIELSTVIEKCSAYTPVPGGVGPMTIVTLIAHGGGGREDARFMKASDEMLMIRPEDITDVPAIHAVHAAAFPTEAEAGLVYALRVNGKVVVSLVAELDGKLVGHVLFSPVSVEPSDDCSKGVGLAPLAVSPAHQQQGIGGQLVEAGLAACRQAGFGFVVVLGNPRYYGRFGFRRALPTNTKVARGRGSLDGSPLSLPFA